MGESSHWLAGRTIIEDPEVERFVDAQSRVAGSRFAEQWEGIKWMLARKPERGTPRDLEEPDKFLVYVFPGIRHAHTYRVAVFYSYNENEVSIRSACLVHQIKGKYGAM